jgi:glycosyltransferase involved in cell wall biosynthesis
VYHEHGDTLMRKERPWLSGMTWSMLGRRAKSLIAISDYVKSQICLRFPHVGPTMQVIRNPLVEEPSLVRLGHARKPLKVGYFGRLNTLKGADRFLELALALESQEVSFHIYGDGPLKPALEIHRANQSVSFHGFTNTPMRKMAEMDLVVVPSRVEPFGLVGLEAQSVGVPVLGFRGSGIEEIVSHGKTGWLLPKDDMGAMLSRLRACIHNPEALASMSKAAHMRALQSFSLEQHVQTLEQLYFRIS